MNATQGSTSLETCIVVDCSEWIRLKWLGSPIGLAFISVLKQDPSLKLGIPEVLVGELDKHRADTAREMLNKLEDVSAEINTITGDPIAAGVVTLTEVDIEVTSRERLTPIAEQIVYPDLSMEEVRRALVRVNAETPPNGFKNQQMKDSLLWEACVTLADRYRVIFVTGDKGFYADRQPKKGLAEELARERSVLDGRLQVFPSLEDAIRALAPGIAADSNEVSGIDSKDLIAAVATEAFRRSPTAADIRADPELRGVVPAYFRTDVPHKFAVSFSAFYYINQAVEGEMQGEAVVSGECRLDTRQMKIEATNLQSIHWKLVSPAGSEFRTSELLDG